MDLRRKPHHFSRIDMDLLKAINKQVEELGWNNIKKILHLNTDYYAEQVYYEKLSKEEICLDIQTLKHKINEIIDKINGE